MAAEATDHRRESTTLHEREDWSTGELQGARQELTALIVVEEEA